MKKAIVTFGLSMLVAALSGCGTPGNSATAVPMPTPVYNASTGKTKASAPPTTALVTKGEQPVAPETNPTGDIPDTQAFVKYHSAIGRYEINTPEGWARTTTGANVSFIDKYDGVKVVVKKQRSAPSIGVLRHQNSLNELGRAVRIQSLKTVKLPGGRAVYVEYTSNSDPNPVTGKQVRLENRTYYFYKDGKVAMFTFWAPLGADNVDQWNNMSRSFRWN